ncbi:epoxide hydrolase [Ceratobasidium sp. AG-Ba]|nr:epoxide hydrolase [Ceratobasidium sp. AG-Ba]
MAFNADIQPFSISVPDQQLEEISKKLSLTRLPDELDLPAGQEWDWGVPLAVLKPTIEYWRTQYNWRTVEERLNRTLPQFTTDIETVSNGIQKLHFVHKRSGNPAAIPLIFVHGWPGNFLEVSKMIDELTNPKDSKSPSFHVVAPSLPGFVFSQRANSPGMEAQSTAAAFDALMKKLGYKHYLAQGGDWGALVCRGFAVYHQDSCLGTHQNYWFSGAPTFVQNPLLAVKVALGRIGLPGGYSKQDMGGLKAAEEFATTGSAYAHVQETRPQTLAVALTDSPAGLLAWIGEKLHAWTDSYPWTPEEWITWTMLYWIDGPAGGLRFYKENFPNVAAIRASSISESPIGFKWSPTPFGFSSFPKEIIPVPPEWAALRQNLVYSKQHTRGGHFAAWEVPELLADDIRNFAQIVRSRDERLRIAS